MGGKNHKDRESNEDMIELLDVSKTDNIYSSLISLKISDERLRLRFSIDPIDFGHLKRILEFRPYENTGVAKYQYFFGFRYSKQNDGLATTSVRVEQLDRHKLF